MLQTDPAADNSVGAEPAFVLASSSPRRRELLHRAGVKFEVCPPALEEPDWPMALRPAQQAEALAYFKARSVQTCDKRSVVLGADTVVAGPSGLLGKPRDADHARQMLRNLSGSRHAVITGVALLGPDCGQRTIASETTYVTMREMSDREVEEYIDSGEWEGKAGGYAIQETADRFVTNVEGSFSNVVGLPIELLERLLARGREAKRPGGESCAG
jgi:septum formation protein